MKLVAFAPRRKAVHVREDNSRTLTGAPAVVGRAGVPVHRDETTASDEQQMRRARLLLPDETSGIRPVDRGPAGYRVGRNGAVAAPDAGPKRRCCLGEQQPSPHAGLAPAWDDRILGSLHAGAITCLLGSGCKSREQSASGPGATSGMPRPPIGQIDPSATAAVVGERRVGATNRRGRQRRAAVPGAVAEDHHRRARSERSRCIGCRWRSPSCRPEGLGGATSCQGRRGGAIARRRAEARRVLN